MINTYRQQLILAYLGYDPGEFDGINGIKTGNAIESFQRDNQLTHDRVWGPKTEAKAKYNVNNDIFKTKVEIDIEPEKPKTNTGAQSTPAPSTTTKPQTGTFWDSIKYFTRDEFRCPCGKWCNGFPVEPSEKLVRAAVELREALGVPVTIVPPDGHSGGSGIRCPQYNATFSNSATNSRHLQGKAIDFSARGASVAKIRAQLEKMRQAGTVNYWYQITDTAFHMDVA